MSAAAYMTDDGLKPGDILVEIDGTSVEKRIETLSPYVVLPEEDKIVNKISEPLLAVKAETAKVKVVRDGRKKSLTVETLKEKFRPKNPYENGLLEGENIGYIDPGVLKKGEIEDLMEAFADTEGMIVDLRSYPSVFIPYLLGEYITPEPKQFASMSFQNRAVPGSFLVQNNLLSGAGVMKKNHMSKKEYPAYHGKVVILMNETSQSQSEFTVMALRQSPNAVVVGSPSIGADGNVVKISLPGRVNMYMSGLGVFTPEGGQTQRVGLTPDVECYPTVEGLRDNRDELIEKAVEIIRGESGE